jgi:hypothetical protein
LKTNSNTNPDHNSIKTKRKQQERQGIKNLNHQPTIGKKFTKHREFSVLTSNTQTTDSFFFFGQLMGLLTQKEVRKICLS